MSDETDEFLAHYGVMGMRWGKRKAGSDESSDSGGKSDSDGKSNKPAKRLSRKEVRKINREGQQKHDQEKLNSILEESLQKGDKVLVATMLQGDYATTIMTGKEFAKHAISGGAINARATNVYASRTTGQFELRDNSNSEYQKVKR